jgi:MFS family permease
MVGMPVLGKTVGYTIRGVRGSSRLLGRGVRGLRSRGGGGDLGMIRLLDLHAASCAGDTLVTMGLAGTIFFNVPAGEARGKVALYLLITMAPFALLAPLIGPLLDRFRHGRRWALAATMLGRAFLAWLISDYINNIGLYPAAFGVLVLSRAYGVARSAAVPRLLPPGLGLSEAGARASVFGTIAGLAVAPIGVAAYWIGPQWPLRIATVIFVMGMVIALRLPAPADSERPETVPGVFSAARKVLTGRLVVATVVGSSALRMLFGFLTLFLAFALRSGDLSTDVLGFRPGRAAAIGLVATALGAGSVIASTVGTRLRIHRPAQLQAVGTLAVALAGVLAAVRYSLATVLLLCLFTAIASGLAKLAEDATIQERISEEVRASAFAHSETLLMLAFVLGGGIGLIPFAGHWGIAAAALLAVGLAGRAILVALGLRRDQLTGSTPKPVADPADATTQVVPGRTEPKPAEPTKKWRRSRSAREEFGPPRAATEPTKVQPATEPHPTTVIERTADDLPTYHLYRPSSPGPENPPEAADE